MTSILPSCRRVASPRVSVIWLASGPTRPTSRRRAGRPRTGRRCTQHDDYPSLLVGCVGRPPARASGVVAGGLGVLLGTGEPGDGGRVGGGAGQVPGWQDGLGAGRVDTGVAGVDAGARTPVGDAASAGNLGVPNLLLFLSSFIAAVALSMNCRQIGAG